MNRKGFSLLESLVVVAIIGVMTSLLLPAVQKARAIALRASCLNNLKQMALAVHSYANDNEGYLVPVTRSTPSNGGWMVSILPYIGQEPLFRRIDEVHGGPPLPSGDPDPHWATGGAFLLANRQVLIPTYICPAEPRRGPDLIYPGPLFGGHIAPTSYPANCGYTFGSGTNYPPWDPSARPDKMGPINLARKVRLSDVTDGTSTTLLIGERPAGHDLSFGFWMFMSKDVVCGVANTEALYPKGLDGHPCPEGPPYRFGPPGPLGVKDPCSANHFWSEHPGGANFAFVDGSIRFLAYNTNPSVMEALSTFAGGEAVSANDF